METDDRDNGKPQPDQAPLSPIARTVMARVGRRMAEKYDNLDLFMSTARKVAAQSDEDAAEQIEASMRWIKQLQYQIAGLKEEVTEQEREIEDLREANEELEKTNAYLQKERQQVVELSHLYDKNLKETESLKTEVGMQVSVTYRPDQLKRILFLFDEDRHFDPLRWGLAIFLVVTRIFYLLHHYDISRLFYSISFTGIIAWFINSAIIIWLITTAFAIVPKLDKIIIAKIDKWRSERNGT